MKSHHVWAVALTGLLAYTLPWVATPATSLTFGGYDLAEWASLHPEVRAAPILITSLLLRLQPAFLALLVALNSPRSPRAAEWWVGALFVVGVTIALLPPLEFFDEAQGDGNYQQQFGLAVLTLIGGIVGLSRFLRGWRVHISVVIALAGAATSIAALFQANALMSAFSLPVHLGIGGLALTTLYALFGVLCWLQRA